jgi:hypothetical protein
MGGLVRLHEPEERFEVPLSVANQAAAFERISRSSFSLRFSRRNRDNSFAPVSSDHRHLCRHRAAPTKSTICRLNSGVYLTLLSAISNTSKANIGVSTKPGQLQSTSRYSIQRRIVPTFLIGLSSLDFIQIALKQS